MSEKRFTPALAYAALTPLYDPVLRLLTRELVWRSAVLRHLDARAGERILDVGCGTASLLLQLASQCADLELHGIDPDEAVLAIAQRKAQQAGATVVLHRGFVSPAQCASLGRFSKVVSTLVLHQTPLAEKRNILQSMYQLLDGGGRLCIADYGQQRSWVMKALFRCTVQLLDGYRDTQPNAEGCLPQLMASLGFVDIDEVEVVASATGTISIYTARKPKAVS
ncbi:class I SAM-dependent methyltransferase [Spongiibacter sp.]|uniref:class I SAM-dependent methyltransferase n=1 Tax=Spongiibacter sp. TaxID=2024860 RepID=UPI003563FBF7